MYVITYYTLILFIRYTVYRGVHQTAQTTKTAPRLPAKWHNRITPQITVHRTTPHHMMQCGL